MPIEMKRLDSGVVVVTIQGRLVLGPDTHRLEMVTGELIKLGQKTFVYDMTAAAYADSSGIGTLVACLTNIKKAGGELRVAGANPRLMRLFEMTGVQTLMALYPTVDAAAEA
jgi:anti-anti-sigma factor